MRITCGKILILVVSAVLPCAALADNTSADGTYTYNISLPNGASFTLTQSAALGVVGSSSLDWSYNGTPIDGYVPPSDGSIYFSGDNGTWTELQIQWMLPDATDSNTADSVDSFTFTEPDTFWSTPGVYSMFPDDGTTYNAIQLVTENIDGSDGNPVFGTVEQGAFYNLYDTPGGEYTPPGTDPPCCSITTTFTPAVAATPEPSTITLLGTGMVVLLGVYRRRRLS
jgi:hypothetical protein